VCVQAEVNVQRPGGAVSSLHRGFLSSEEESVCFTALAGKAMKFLRDVW
jgi:hypothetical protein